MYCSVKDIRTYLDIDARDDDPLLATLLAAAQSRIDDVCKRRFEATADSVRYFNPECATSGQNLYFDDDLCSITSLVSNSISIPATEYKLSPRNLVPWFKLTLKLNSTYTWIWSVDPEDSIVVTGRWACMMRKTFTAISRASNQITATVSDTSGMFAGQNIHVVEVADTGFNGNFTISTVTASTVTWAQSGADDTDTTGAILFTPPSIRQACVRLAGWLYRQKDNQTGDTDRPILAGDGSVIMPTTLPQDVQSILSQWIRITA
jgi:hypothetical protein